MAAIAGTPLSGARCRCIRGASLPVEDRRALKWLEGLEPPQMAAPKVRRGEFCKLYVPNNDLDAVGGDPDRVNKIRTDKTWRPCFFDAAEPVLYVWDFDSGRAEAERIRGVATRLYQLGRGVDMAWAAAEILSRDGAAAALAAHSGVLHTPGGGGDVPVPHEGTLASLVERYKRFRTRLTWDISADGKPRQLFAQPPSASFRSVGYGTPPQRLYFELRDESGFAPRPLRSAAALVTGLRDAAAEKLQTALPEKAALFEKLIIGRGAGPRDVDRRIRLIPIPSIGAEHTDPSIRRLLIEIPAECPIRADDLRWAFAGLAPRDPGTGESWPGRLVSTDDSRMADRFAGCASMFHSVTAVALSAAERRRVGADEDGSAKNANERLGEERRAAGAIVQALRHAGVRARPSDISVQREPFLRRGATAERFADGSRFSKHTLWHVELRFSTPVPGPLIVGDGRFIGLGLMAPVVE